MRLGAAGLGLLFAMLAVGVGAGVGWAQDSPPGPTGITACGSATVYVNEAVTCSYTESDPDSTTGDSTPNGYPGPSFGVSFSSSHAGTFSPSASCVATTTLIDNSSPPDGIDDSWSGGCSVTYTPLESGTHVITATGANDSDFDSIGVLARDVSVVISSCSPSPALVGDSVTCTITVTDVTTQGSPLAPDGTVDLSSSLQGGLGSCTLSPVSGSASGCAVTFTAAVKGTHTLTAAYTEDAADGRQHNDGSSSGSLTVLGIPTTTTLDCPDDGANDFFDGANFYIRAGTSETCTATVTAGSGPGITGTVSFSTTGAGSFSPNPCTLPGGSLNESCNVAYTEPTEGTFTLTASYAGDATYDPSSGTFTVLVDGTPPQATFGIVSGPSYGACPGPGCYVTGSTALRVDVVDPVSGGVASGLSTCSIGISGPTPGSAPCNAPFSISGGDGLYTLTVSAQDRVGNALTVQYQLNLDNTPPDIQGPFHNNTTCWPSCTAGDVVLPNTYVKALDQATPSVPKSEFYYTITDAGSGLQSCSLTGDTVPTGAYNSGDVFTMQPGDGLKTIGIQCSDNLGNTSTHSVDVIVDDTPPQFTKSVGSPNWPVGCQGDSAPDCYVRGDTPLEIGVSDPPAGGRPGSGVRSSSCRVTGTVDFGSGTPPGPTTFCPPNPLSFTLGSAGDDRYRFDVYAEDNLGNAATADDFLVVVLDNTPPQIDDPVHTNATCYPFDRCDAVPEVVVDGTWVKAQDKLPFYPSNPLLPDYPQFIPRSTFEYPNVYDPTVDPPGGAPPGGLDGSGMRGCTLGGGTTLDGFHPGASIAGRDFSFLPGDGARSFGLTCEDNLGNSSAKGRTLNVDDTPPEATFVTAGPRYDDPADGTIFVESNTLITPVLTDAGVGVDLDGIGGPPADIGPTNPPCLQNQDRNAALIQRCTTPFTFPPPDRDHHLWIMRPDLLGNVAESHFVFIVDDTPPRVELITPQDQARYLLNSTVLADWRVTDDVSFFEGPVEPPFAPGLVPRGSGIREIVVTTPKGEPIDTWSVGAKVFTLIAVDNLGHQTVAQITYHVVYAFSIDPALEAALAEGRYTAGSEVPLSFRLEDAHDRAVTDARPQIRLFTAQGDEIPLSADGGPVLARYDPELNRYVYTLDTRQLGLRPGDYEIWVQPGDATTHKLKLTLR